MQPGDQAEAAVLLASLIHSDHVAEHSAAYGGAGEDAAIRRALRLFLDRPELGFTWLTVEDSMVVGLITVCFAVSTNLGAIVAKLPDFVVTADARRRGVGRFMMASLVEELRRMKVGRVDLGVHETNDGARRFYERLGFIANHELGMSLVL